MTPKSKDVNKAKLLLESFGSAPGSLRLLAFSAMRDSAAFGSSVDREESGGKTRISGSEPGVLYSGPVFRSPALLALNRRLDVCLARVHHALPHVIGTVAIVQEGDGFVPGQCPS